MTQPHADGVLRLLELGERRGPLLRGLVGAPGRGHQHAWARVGLLQRGETRLTPVVHVGIRIAVGRVILLSDDSPNQRRALALGDRRQVARQVLHQVHRGRVGGVDVGDVEEERAPAGEVDQELRDGVQKAEALLSWRQLHRLRPVPPLGDLR